MSGAQPRIDENVSDVGKQIEHDVDSRRDEHDALHDRIISVEDGVDDQFTEAWNGENLFGQDRARKKRSEFDRAQASRSIVRFSAWRTLSDWPSGFFDWAPLPTLMSSPW
jgi:hypothetical protein